MYKIAVIGSRQTIMGFAALGLDVFPAEDDGEAKKILHTLTKGEQTDVYSIIYIEENLAAGLSADIDKFKDSPTPAIILIPGKNGSMGLGLSALHTAVERAVGSDILNDSEGR